MNPIRGYTDLILESPGLPEAVAGMVLRIRRAVDRMANVVDNMLALSVSGRPPTGLSASALVIERTIEEMGPELQGVDLMTKFRAGRVACAEERPQPNSAQPHRQRHQVPRALATAAHHDRDPRRRADGRDRGRRQRPRDGTGERQTRVRALLPRPD